MMVSVGCSSILLAALMAASVALQRSFAAAQGYSMSEGDQLRVQDYIAMDCRRATAASVANGVAINDMSNPGNTISTDNVLTLTIPNYYNAHNDKPTWSNASPVGLIADGYGGFVYGTGGTPAGTMTIRYYQQRSTFVREVAGTQTAIATNVSSFTVTPLDLTSSVSCKITFAPSFTNLPGPGPIAGTTVYSNTFLRNAAARM